MWQAEPLLDWSGVDYKTWTEHSPTIDSWIEQKTNTKQKLRKKKSKFIKAQNNRVDHSWNYKIY